MARTFILSHSRNLAELTDLSEVKEELRTDAENFRIDYVAMCESDNTDCPE